MSASLDFTHDPSRKSWVGSANLEAADFPLQNLPLGRFSRPGSETCRVGMAIGDQVVDLEACVAAGLLTGKAADAVTACDQGYLNGMMALGRPASQALRERMSRLLEAGNEEMQGTAGLIHPQSEVDLHMPARVGDYTDFYASIDHATNVGSMFRPDNPLLPNYKWIPVGYHGRASSVVISGTPVTRPLGQTKADDAEAPSFGPSRLLDYELEVGFFVGPGNEAGQPVAIGEAEEHIFGFCLVNDWSARDLQKWEYVPLGPFLAKSFATTISPWVVTSEALAPFRCAARTRPEGDPAALPHLLSAANESAGGIDLQLEVHMRTQSMREKGMEPHRLTSGNFQGMYWTVAQMLTHHSSNGCNLRPGDLMASGTVSGSAKDSRGSLLELSWRGTEPFTLPSGEERRFLQDGDEVLLRGRCEREGAVGIGFGPCTGVVLPAPRSGAGA